MNENLLCSPPQLTRLLATGLLVLAGLTVQAQAPIFTEDFEGAASGFTVVNGTEANKWVVGTAGGNGPTTAGTRAAYISNDAGVTNAYTLTSTAVTHLYRDVVFPAGQGVALVSFDWKAGGESTYDYLRVQVAPTTFTPVAGAQPAGTGVTVAAQLNLQGNFGRSTVLLPASVAGTTQRLIFTWANDSGGGVQPPVVIDNVTVTARVASPLSGAYTINSALPTAGTNFASFSDAADRLNQDGVSGPVTFAVTGGPYTEQLLLNQIPGSSATNTVVVNGGSSTIRFGSANSNQRAVVQLNGTDFTTISNLVIDATNGGTPGTYGYGVLLTNAADNDRIAGCTINAGIATTSTNFAGIVVNGSTSSASTTGNSANNMVLEGNTVNGGYYSLSLFGASTTALNTGNIVRNNNFRDFYFYGIYTGYQDGAQFIGNDISRPLRANPSSFYGLYTFGSSRSQAIEKNRLHDPFTGNPTSTEVFYGLYIVTSTGGTAATPNDLVNNTFYNLNGNGLQYLIYNSGAAYSRIYNNTLLSDNQTATTSAVTYGVYNTGANTDVRNNIISISRTGPGLKFGLYYTVATTSNYNDLYTPTGSVGYYNAAFATLANWQTANGATFDQNSVSLDPIFRAPATGSLTPDNVLLNNIGTPLTRVTEDITGATRSAAPDPGAYEFAPAATDVAPAALLSPAASASCFGPAEPITVQLRNAGTAALNFATNATTITVVATVPGGTTQTFTTTVNTGTLASGATQSVTLPGTLNMVALGTYSFAIAATTVGDLNATNNALTVTRTAITPVAGTLAAGVTSFCGSGSTVLTLAGSAGGNIQYQSSSDNVTFTDVAGATAATYTTPVFSGTTYYRVRTTCNANAVTSNVVTVTVNNPVISAVPSPLNVCAGATASLSATVPAGVSVRYFTAATGGTAVGTGNPYTTPALTANTTYYAEAFAATTSVAGLVDNSTANGTFSQSTFTDYPLGFAVTQAGTLATVDVYPTAAGALTIRLYRVSGSQPAGSPTAVAGSDVTITVTAAQAGTRVTVPVNYALTPGEYKLSNAGGGLGRFSTYTGTYPLTSPSGVLTVRGSYTTVFSTSYANTTYNGFFNLTFVNECVGTARTAIQVNVTPGLVAALPTATAASCGVAPYSLAGTIAGLATGAVYTSTGTGTFSPNATTLNATYTPSAADVAAGTVTLTITPTGPSAACTSTGQVVLTLAAPPVAAFSYPVATYCTGTAATVAPVLATGGVAGTFTASGSGLRIDPVTGVINLATTLTSGTFTITNTVTTTGACSSTTAVATITINPGVAAPMLTATALPGGGVQLSTNPVAGVQYQFFVNNVAVGPASGSFSVTVPTVPVNGSYTVVLSVPGGCSSAPSTPVLVTAVAVASRNGVSLRIYPNPTATGELTLELSGVNAKTSQLTVLNALGQVVYTDKVSAGTAALHLPNLAAGLYIFQVKTAEGVLTQRVVRE
jgi:hypothetical protein